ncbi:peptidase S9 [Kineosporia sp. NBRC 101677]|uniref:S9 family peptidase n=1 Tax=Kineosporia sp. NBRC 101677 TaxID=3032197 RepID=UPI0024A522BD|nr:S9 family peptidase [Kineosporia sp. NBRC 101677]GLY14014.1 peptidase S9 [Kineosporia sp. NBRC 101677]
MNLDHFLELPRLSGLSVSPDGDRLVVTVSVLDPKRTGFTSSLWEVPVDPQGPAPRRLTWGGTGESRPVFRPDGSLLFTSARPDPDDDEEERPASLWLMPDRGEARPYATRPGGISSVVVAAEAGTVVLTSPTLPSSTSPGEDERRRKARRELKVSATLHESIPVRWWDEFWGPAADRLFVLDDEGTARDLTGPTGPALRPEPDYAVSPDGSTVICSWTEVRSGGVLRPHLISIDVPTGARRTLLTEDVAEFRSPAFSADGSKVAFVSEAVPSPDTPEHQRLMVLHLTGDRAGQVHEAAPGWDRWPTGTPVWTPDGEALLVTADDQGHAPVFRIDLDRRTVRKLTDRGAFTDLTITRDGSGLYALRSSVDSPPAPVRIDPRTGEVTALRGPAEELPLPGTLTEVTTTAEDGTPLRGWLVLPEQASADRPAPLLLWVHGGPLGSWNGWHWRWNPWLAAAQGYAVLLPDPALSTGYGLDFVRRGWGAWGGAPYTDLMRITDVTVEREDIDAGRTAAMGASYGGYMANWIAGHTDRFRGIVAHASIWDLDTFRGTTDAGFYWRQIMTAQARAEHSPARFAESITTPMLVIHGEKDYRTPISEGLALFARLGELNVGEDGTMPHRLLVFPDENHWVLRPQNLCVWYETVFAFLAQTVQGEPWQTPDLLR